MKRWLWRQLIVHGKWLVRVLGALVFVLMVTVLYLVGTNWWRGPVVAALVLTSMLFGFAVVINQVVRDAHPDIKKGADSNDA